jgi:excisionase family DNA binding protein
MLGLNAEQIHAACSRLSAAQLAVDIAWFLEEHPGGSSHSKAVGISMGSRKGKKSAGRKATPSGLRPGAESAVLTLRDLADYLNCHYGTAFKLARRGDIPGFRFGVDGGWRFLKSDVDKWIAGGGARPRPYWRIGKLKN